MVTWRSLRGPSYRWQRMVSHPQCTNTTGRSNLVHFSIAVMQAHHKRCMGYKPFYSLASEGSNPHGFRPEENTPINAKPDPNLVSIPAGSNEMVVDNLGDPGGMSTGDSDNAMDCTAVNLLSKVGQYYYRSLIEKESAFAERYIHKYWHFKS